MSVVPLLLESSMGVPVSDGVSVTCSLTEPLLLTRKRALKQYVKALRVHFFSQRPDSRKSLEFCELFS